MPINTDSCADCGSKLPSDMAFCPHCGRPGNFPNVRAAAGEAAALDVRYRQAIANAAARGAAEAVAAFEAATAASFPVRNVGELELRVLSNETAMTSTFERMLSAEAMLRSADAWTRPRLIAGAAMFPGYQQDIRFGAIAIGPDPIGVESYGPFTLILKEEMVAHRSIVFETNSARLVVSNGVGAGGRLTPPGSFATWDNRAKLAVAKLAATIPAGTPSREFDEILLKPGLTSADDEFIELQVYRPITIRGVARVIVRRGRMGPSGRRTPSRAIASAVRTGLRRAGLRLEEL